MEYRLLICEECENIISVEDNQEETFICPACGTINDRKRIKLYTGSLTIVSPEMKCRIGTDEDEGIIGMHEAEDDLVTALMTLSKYGWHMKFKGEQSNTDSDKED